MPRRYVPTVVIVGILAAVAVFGYLSPKQTQAEPMRILFDNSGGKVIFDHKTHAENYGIECQTCHHESETARPDPMACGDCHGVAVTDEFRKEHVASYSDEACVTCHHVEFTGVDWSHEEHTGYDDCTACHHGPDIEPEPMACSNCHEAQGDESMPGLRDSVHRRCQTCHADMFEEKMDGCDSCHTSASQREALKNGTLDKAFTACASCHYEEKVDELIPNRMGAFHGQCMGCHEEVQSGPFEKSQCNQCHFR